MKSNTKKTTRRKFIRDTAGTMAAISIGQSITASVIGPAFSTKKVPTRILGKTGVEIPIMIIGTGSRFMARPADEGLEILQFALDQGFYYWDTAANYGNDKEASEERIGRILPDVRKKVFLATKVHERDTDEAKRIVERSLNRLQTDYIDLLQIHSINDLEDVDNLKKPGGVVELLHDYKRQGIVRYIGFTGHTSAEAMKKAAGEFDADTMLIALNHQAKGKQRFEEDAIGTAGRKEMGVLAMKVIRPRETVEKLDPKDLIRYALSLEHVTSAVIGTDNLDLLKQNIELVKHFHPLPGEKMEELNMALQPFYESKELAWMKEGYVDGYLGVS